MQPRLKKFLGLFILLPALFLYLFAAAALSEQLPSFWLLKLVYFIIAGTVWAFPVKYLLRWMNTEPKM